MKHSGHFRQKPGVPNRAGCFAQASRPAGLESAHCDTDVAVVRRLKGSGMVQTDGLCTVPLLSTGDKVPLGASLDVCFSDGSVRHALDAWQSVPKSDSWRLLYFLKGSGLIAHRLAPASMRVTAGDMVLLPPGHTAVRCDIEAEAAFGASSGVDNDGILSWMSFVLPLDLVVAEAAAARAQENVSEAGSASASRAQGQVPDDLVESVLSAAKRHSKLIGSTVSSAPATAGSRSEPAGLKMRAVSLAGPATRRSESVAMHSTIGNTGPDVPIPHFSTSSGAAIRDSRSLAHEEVVMAPARESAANSAPDLDGSSAAPVVSQLHDLRRHLERIWRLTWHRSGSRASGPELTKVSLNEAPSFQLPNQSNQLALFLDPVSHRVPITFGVEIFPAGHRTPPHVHDIAHELFFIIAGTGEAFCNDKRFRVGPGDTVVFPPGCTHGIDADDGGRMYCLELMLPNEKFAEFVRAGIPVDKLDGEDICILTSIGCN